MRAEEETAPTPRVRRPIAAVAATLLAGAAIVGYSSYWFADALGIYLHCNPPPKNTLCSGTTTFWGLDPTFFLLAVIVGIVAGALLAILAFVLYFRPRNHTVIGTFVLMFSVVSIVAYGGYYVGIAAGCAGGILALLFRPPRYRELTQWSNRPTGRIGGGTEEFAGKHRTPTSFGTAAVVPEKGETAPLSSDAYAPPPPPRRAYPPPALGPPVSASPSAARTVPDSALPRYGNLSDALTGRPASAAARSAPRPVISPPPPPHPAARPTVSAASAAWVPPSRPSSVPARSAAAAAPVPPSSASGSPVVLPRSAAAPDGVATGPVTQQRSWKCPKCGLTNAPWSANCTRCQTPVPRM